ncbi:uncharacterized protein CDAR_295231 [Caerostris darwini]|uniref:Ig-like domain-containing protein n=1 Tax=Caerostris darwini TaxID=1538125 RepID=A0AAV4P808_9ARAC|nr:uncharacterized protein CDAR_295231 [Caerostris darwini]
MALTGYGAGTDLNFEIQYKKVSKINVVIQCRFNVAQVLPPMIACLKISSFEVPSLLVPGDSAYLTCLFDLAGEKLYSVKWYKDEQEFYRFFPSLTPQYMAFRAPGIHVDIDPFMLISQYALVGKH